jgi:peptidase A4-like protein
MRKIACFLIGLLLPAALSTPVLAAAPQTLVNSHPGFFISHRGPASVAGTASNTSENWSGYAATGATGAFTSVSSSWTQPVLNCAVLPGASYSAYWVGLDGFNDQTVEQIGTEANCIRNSASYVAWYEMYPSNPYEVSVGLTVGPGDQIAASVNYTPSTSTTTIVRGRAREVTTSASYRLTLTDSTTGKSFITSISPRQSYSRSSAEVITEAPYSNGILPLADYGIVNYSKALVDGSSFGSLPNLQAIIMQNPAGMVSTPSGFDSANQNFSTTWSDSSST